MLLVVVERAESGADPDLGHAISGQVLFADVSMLSQPRRARKGAERRAHVTTRGAHGEAALKNLIQSSAFGLNRTTGTASAMAQFDPSHTAPAAAIAARC